MPPAYVRRPRVRRITAGARRVQAVRRRVVQVDGRAARRRVPRAGTSAPGAATAARRVVTPPRRCGAGGPARPGAQSSASSSTSGATVARRPRSSAARVGVVEHGAQRLPTASRLGRLEVVRSPALRARCAASTQHQPAGAGRAARRRRQLEGGAATRRSSWRVEGRRGRRRCGGASGPAGWRSRTATPSSSATSDRQQQRPRPVSDAASRAARRGHATSPGRPRPSRRPQHLPGHRRPVVAPHGGRARRVERRPPAPGRRSRPATAARQVVGVAGGEQLARTRRRPAPARNAGRSLASTGAPAAIASTSTMPKLSPPVFGATYTSAGAQQRAPCRRRERGPRNVDPVAHRSRRPASARLVDVAAADDEQPRARAGRPRRRRTPAAARSGPCAARPAGRRTPVPPVAAATPAAARAVGEPLDVHPVRDHDRRRRRCADQRAPGVLGDRDPARRSSPAPAAGARRGAAAPGTAPGGVERRDHRALPPTAPAPRGSGWPARGGAGRRSARRAASGARGRPTSGPNDTRATDPL